MKKFTNNQKGQGIMEYVIISGLIGILCLGAMKTFGEKIQTRIEQMNRSVQNKLVIQQ